MNAAVVSCITNPQALQRLHECLETGEIILTGHFKAELSNERIAFEDAWAVLRYGRIFDPPEEDTRSGEWKYRVEGHEPGGKWIAVVFSFKSVTRANLITIFSVKAKGKRQ